MKNRTRGERPAGLRLLAAAYDMVDSDNPLNGSIRSLMSGWSTESGHPIVHDSAVLAVAFSPDGREALIGGHDRAARLWDIQTITPIGHLLRHADSVRAVAFSPNGALALTGCQDKAAHLWDLKSQIPFGKPLEHSNEVWCVAFSPDGKTAASGGRDFAVRLWDVRTAVSLEPPLKHTQNVLCISFSPDGRRLLTGCFDGTVRIWDVHSKAVLESEFQLGKNKGIYAIAFSPDGSRILTASARPDGDRFGTLKVLSRLANPCATTTMFTRQHGVPMAERYLPEVLITRPGCGMRQPISQLASR